MDFQDNISDFKSTSLDLLYNQVSLLIASYNEMKASGEINDVFEKRLLLLQKTIGSMKSLIQNVEEFNDLDENVTFNDKDNSTISVSNGEDDNEKSESASDLIFNSPLISDNTGNSSSVMDDSDANTSVVSDSATVPDDDDFKGTESKVSNAVKGSLILNSPVQEEPSITVSDNDNGMQVTDSASVNLVDINTGTIANLEKFHRISSSPVKAILVNENQFRKLSDSLSTQTRQLDFGVSASDENMSVEEMLEKANDLYNSGDRQAAEKLYDQISNMTLIKKTA